TQNPLRLTPRPGSSPGRATPDWRGPRPPQAATDESRPPALLRRRVDGEPEAQPRREGEPLLVTGNLIVGEVVERMSVERGLLLAVAAGEAGQLSCGDRARNDHRTHREDRPVANAGGSVARGPGAGAGRVGAGGILREEVEAATRRVHQALRSLRVGEAHDRVE